MLQLEIFLIKVNLGSQNRKYFVVRSEINERGTNSRLLQQRTWRTEFTRATPCVCHFVFVKNETPQLTSAVGGLKELKRSINLEVQSVLVTASSLTTEFDVEPRVIRALTVREHCRALRKSLSRLSGRLY